MRNNALLNSKERIQYLSFTTGEAVPNLSKIFYLSMSMMISMIPVLNILGFCRAEPSTGYPFCSLQAYDLRNSIYL
jgi:hypothetical protein